MNRPRPTALRLLAALLALLTFPGWAEVLENVEHLIHDGHFAHSEEHVASDPDDHGLGSHAETGCTAIDHHCGCCVSVAAHVPPGAARLLMGPAVLREPVIPTFVRSPPTRFLSPPLRPPIS